MEKYTIDNPNVIVSECGPSPIDKIVIIEYQKEDIYLTAYSDPMTNVFFALKKSYIECAESGIQIDDYIIEDYDDLQDASESEYIRDFLKLDAMLDSKWVEIKDQERDTRYSGMKVGASFEESGMVIFAETFNHSQPEYKEYIQIVKRNGKYTYSASHESYFMKYQLGDLYTMYFGEPPKEEYYIKISDLKDLDRKYYYFAQSFRNLQKTIEENEYLNGVAKLSNDYDTIITSIRGLNKDGHKIIEMVLDKSRAERLYLCIRLDGSDELLYSISKNSMLEAILLRGENVECIEEQKNIESLNVELKRYFGDLKKAYDYMIQNRHNYIWRYGDGNKYNI